MHLHYRNINFKQEEESMLLLSELWAPVASHVEKQGPKSIQRFYVTLICYFRNGWLVLGISFCSACVCMCVVSRLLGSNFLELFTCCRESVPHLLCNRGCNILVFRHCWMSHQNCLNHLWQIGNWSINAISFLSFVWFVSFPCFCSCFYSTIISPHFPSV